MYIQLCIYTDTHMIIYNIVITNKHFHPPLRTLAKKKDTTINQITSFVNAENAALNDKVFVAIAAVAAKNAQAPTGKGSNTRPAIVETNIERRVHPWLEIPSGVGTRN